MEYKVLNLLLFQIFSHTLHQGEDLMIAFLLETMLSNLIGKINYEMGMRPPGMVCAPLSCLQLKGGSPGLRMGGKWVVWPCSSSSQQDMTLLQIRVNGCFPPRPVSWDLFLFSSWLHPLLLLLSPSQSTPGPRQPLDIPPTIL